MGHLEAMLGPCWAYVGTISTQNSGPGLKYVRLSGLKSG